MLINFVQIDIRYKNCKSAVIVSMKVLVLLLFRRNYDSKTILILVIIVVVTLRLSGIIVNFYLATSLLARVIACECRHRDKGHLRLVRPFLGFN